MAQTPRAGHIPGRNKTRFQVSSVASKVDRPNCTAGTRCGPKLIHERDRTTNAGAQERRSRSSGWDHLKHLLPYVARYKKMVGAGPAVADADGHCGLPAAVDHRHHHGLPERLAAAAFDSHGHLARHSPSAFFVLRTAQPPCAGPVLPDSGRRDAGEGFPLLLDPLDSDRHFARNRVRPAQRPAGAACCAWSRNFTCATAPAT